MSVDLACDAHCNLGEAPVWDAKTGTLYFVDINSKKIHAFSPSSSSHQAVELTQPIGTIVPTTKPHVLLAALERDVVEVDMQTGKQGRVLATTPEEHGVEAMRFNDGKVSPQGTLLVGRMHSKWREENRGRLYRLDPGSSEFKEVLSPKEVWLPNGIAWREDQPIVYFIDSGTETIVEYQTDGQGIPRRDEQGKLQARTLASLPSGHQHVPDGMTIDTDGNLWVALGESGAIACYDAKSGKELRRVQLPVKRPTACTFGGDQLQHLYVTTRVETGEDASPHHGGLFRITIPGVRGVAPAYEFPL